MHVTKAAVVGAGTMGGEIASVVASAGIPVLLKDVEDRFVEIGIERAAGIWRKLVEAGKLGPDEADRRLALVTGVTDYDGFGDVDYVIEAVPERIEVKRAVFAELDAATSGRAILATNTSALSIGEIAAATTRPDKVVGFHFFFPASKARLIEVVEGATTSHETLLAAFNFAQTLKKAPIICADSPGFVVNRVLTATMSEMFGFMSEQDLTPAELDDLVTGAGLAETGPCRLADLLGLDTVLSVAEYLRDRLGDEFVVSERMSELVASGDLGRKTGKGFYDYD